MTPGPLRDPDDVLAAAGRLLGAAGKRVEPGAVVDLDPLFHDLFLGSDIKSLDRVVSAAVHAHKWFVPAPGPGRRYALTVAGAERLSSLPSRLWRGLSRGQLIALAALVLAVLAALLFLQ